MDRSVLLISQKQALKFEFLGCLIMPENLVPLLIKDNFWTQFFHYGNLLQKVRINNEMSTSNSSNHWALQMKKGLGDTGNMK